MYIRRRFNSNYLAALGTTQDVLEGKVAAPYMEKEESETPNEEKEAQQVKKVDNNDDPQEEIAKQVGAVGDKRIGILK